MTSARRFHSDGRVARTSTLARALPGGLGQVAIKSVGCTCQGLVRGEGEGLGLGEVAETDFREETAGAGLRPRGLQIRLVSGNACIIGTPTPSTTKPRTSHGQVIMNRGSNRGRGTRCRLHLRAEQTRAVRRGRRNGRQLGRETERDSRAACSPLRTYPSRRPPPAPVGDARLPPPPCA